MVKQKSVMPPGILSDTRCGHRVWREGKSLIITLDRPECANSLDPESCEALSLTFDAFADDDELQVAIVSAEGNRHFCAGLDLRAVQPGRRVQLPSSGFAGLTSRQLDKPVIAAVNGVALGGGFELALACDMIIADANARFSLPEPRVGQAALAGGLLRLPLSIGKHRALELILTSRMVTADEGWRLGFVNQVAEPGQALNLARAIAGEIVKGSPLALQASKAVALTHERSAHGTNTEGWPAESVERMLDSEDIQEGAMAFLEKREPQWKGR